jgi:cobyrinic acid a,c-diamide synthase
MRERYPAATIPTYVIAGAASNVGKTMISLALCRAFVRRAMRVAPFKLGPDYIDARFYRTAANAPAHNLDLWLDGDDAVRAAVADFDADVALCEGMMGLFDGANDGSASSAAIAKVIGARIILVIDCRAASQTAAAVALGLAAYDPSLEIAGVILNRIASDRHEQAVRAAFERTGLRVLAVVRTNADYAMPERHLGLDAQALERRFDAVDRLATELAVQIPFEELVPTSNARPPRERRVGTVERATIALAHDDAFWFTYAETREALERAGARVVAFSPLVDTQLPPDADAVWLPGGYPERYAAQLSANVAMRDAVAAHARAGGPLYAECGGAMYVLDELETADGTFPMVGAVRGRTSMARPKLHLGYRSGIARSDGPLDRRGDAVRGHVFHYCTVVTDTSQAAYDLDDGAEGIAHATIVASFLHRRFLSGSPAIERFVTLAARFRAKRHTLAAN